MKFNVAFESDGNYVYFNKITNLLGEFTPEEHEAFLTNRHLEPACAEARRRWSEIGCLVPAARNETRLLRDYYARFVKPFEFTVELSRACNFKCAYCYQTGTHWLTSIGSSARTYDANGNTTGNATGGDTFGYGYNDRNRMTVVQRNGQTVGSYTYNAMGQRVAKVAAVTQRFAYDEGSQLVGEYGATSRSYVWLGSLPVAVVDTSGAMSIVSYVHGDALGSPRTVTDGAGSAVWQWSYPANPFGEKVPSIVGVALNLRFPGQYYDAESGLNYNVNRDYEAATGRYIQSDPLRLMAGPSTYAYVDANPLSYVDPLGLTKWSVGIFMAGGGNWGGEAGWAHFIATSECVDGRQGYADGHVLFIGGSFGTPVAFSGSTYTVDDNMPGNTDPSVLNGPFVYQGVGGSMGAGYGVSGIRIGMAQSGGLAGGVQGGLGWAISHDFGRSFVTSSSQHKCGCK